MWYSVGVRRSARRYCEDPEHRGEEADDEREPACHQSGQSSAPPDSYASGLPNPHDPENDAQDCGHEADEREEETHDGNDHPDPERDGDDAQYKSRYRDPVRWSTHHLLVDHLGRRTAGRGVR
jgi:hypothetical protein